MALTRLRGFVMVVIAAALVAPGASFAGLPTFPLNCGNFGPAVNPLPRPCGGAVNVGVRTSIYFETQQDTVAPNPDVDPNTITATLQRSGGPVVPMLNLNQQFASGFSGSVTGPAFLENPRHWGFLIVPTTALTGNSTYTVTLNGKATDGSVLAQRQWSFATRRALGTESAAFTVDLSGATVNWQGFFYSGIGKPSFATTALYDQEPLHDLIDEARVQAPDLFAEQRIRGLTETYWSGIFSAGDAVNLVREQETRQVKTIATAGGTTTLTIDALAEGGLFDIPADRQANSKNYLQDDFVIPGQTVQVLVCDRTKCQQSQVISVNESTGTMTITALSGSWTVQPPVYPTDNPKVPDHFPYAYTTVRRFSPAGTPVYYWGRLHSELDEHVINRDRRPHLRFYGTPFDLCRKSNNAGDDVGGACADGPKSWDEWDLFVRTAVGHVIDRYTDPSINPNANPLIPGHPVINWDFEIPNEPDLNIYWVGTPNQQIEYYDYTANAILRAFEERGINSSNVHVGGVEIGLVGVTDPRSETPYLYHASPTAEAPAAAGVHEGNYVCENPAFNAKRSARVNALCNLPGPGGLPANKGTPLAFLSVHTYSMSADAAARLIAARDNALAIDATTFANIPVNSHETVPDWVPHKDPDSQEVFRWSGYFSTWATDYFRRLLSRAVTSATVTDGRYANGETVITTWPPYNNFSDGRPSIASNLFVDDNDDGTTDRIVAVANPFFRVAELMARMPRAVAPLLTSISDAGVDIAGFRAVGADVDWIVLYAHDRLDTGSRETGLWNVTLNLNHIRFPVVKVSEYRFDRTHPAKAALDQLGVIASSARYGSNKAAQVDALAAASELAPDGPAVYRTPASGALQLTTPLYAQGVVILEISGRCGNGHLDADEVCDDGNNTDGDCCSSTCSAKQADGTLCNDFNACTGSSSQPDKCLSGSCGASCQLTTACTVPECGIAGTCQIDGTSGLCRCLP